MTDEVGRELPLSVRERGGVAGMPTGFGSEVRSLTGMELRVPASEGYIKYLKASVVLGT